MENTDFIPFALPEIGEDEIDEVSKLLRSGWITTGPKAKQFESEFGDYLGGGFETVAVNSATAGLHLALEALGIGPGDEVITTTHTFTATAEVIRYMGADPVFVDISPETLCIDPSAIEGAITSRTKAIIPVHFAGRSADMDKIIKLAKRFGLKVLEDAAHALPTTFCGKMIGTLDSDVTVFSFYANKTITTGEGGMLVTKDKKIAERVKIMRLHGINRDAFDRFTAKTPSWYYEVVAPGYKYNMMDLCAAIGIHQLRKSNRYQSKRAEIARFYDNSFESSPIIKPSQPLKGDIHSWHLYVIQILDETPGARDRFILNMFERGIGCSVHYIPLHLQPYWRDMYGLMPDMFPVSQRVFERCVSLPIYTSMTTIQTQRVVEAVSEVLKK